MKKRKKRLNKTQEEILGFIKKLIGLIIIIIGLVSLFVPIIPGIIIIILGALLMGDKKVKKIVLILINRSRKNEKKKSYNPFKMWGSYVLAVIFATISVYIAINRGNLLVPGFLEKIILVIAFPTAILGLSIQDKIPEFAYYSLVILIEFIYGFLLGWGIHALIRKKTK
jgi:uncharacterized membrane protein